MGNILVQFLYIDAVHDIVSFLGGALHLYRTLPNLIVHCKILNKFQKISSEMKG